MSTWSSRTHIALEAPSLAAILQLTRDDSLDVGVHFTEGRKPEYRAGLSWVAARVPGYLPARVPGFLGGKNRFLPKLYFFMFAIVFESYTYSCSISVTSEILLS